MTLNQTPHENFLRTPLPDDNYSDSKDTIFSDCRGPMIITLILGTRFSILGTRIGSLKT